MSPGDDKFEFEAVQDHYGESMERLRLLSRNTRRRDLRGRTYRRQMRRVGATFLGLGIAVFLVVALVSAL